MHSSFVIPEALFMLFWDVDPATLDLELHKEFIIERVLNMGDEESLKWLWHEYGERVIYDTVINSRRLNLKTARCRQNYFNLKEGQMRCFSAFLESPDYPNPLIEELIIPPGIQREKTPGIAASFSWRSAGMATTLA